MEGVKFLMLCEYGSKASRDYMGIWGWDWVRNGVDLRGKDR